MKNKKILWLLLSFPFFVKGKLKSETCQAKRIKLVILDNSGTTNDCGVYAPAVVFIRLFAQYGIEISMPEARKPMGLFKRDHIQAILQIDEVREKFKNVYKRDWNKEDVEKMFKDFVPMQMECLSHYADLIPGVPNTINLVREKFGVAIGSTTGFNKEMNELLLQNAKKQGYYPDVYTSASQVKRARPYWYMVEENMRLAGVLDPEEVLKVGDTRADMQEGKAIAKVAESGTWTLGLSATGNYVGKQWQELVQTPGDVLQQEICSAEKILYEAGADYVAPNINSLPQIIEIINQRLQAGEKPREISLDYLDI